MYFIEQSNISYQQSVGPSQLSPEHPKSQNNIMTTNFNLKEQFLQAYNNHDIEKATACITLGVDVLNIRDIRSWSALTSSSYNQSLLDLILSQPNIDVNMKGPGDNTALMDACHEGLETAVRRLCQVPGIEVNCKDAEDGFTAAMFAVDSNHVACVQVRTDYNLIVFS